MISSTCPRGHQSATRDYCDVCGAPMARSGAGPAEPGNGAVPAPLLPAAGGAGRSGADSGWPGSGSGAGSGHPGEGPDRGCPVCGTPQVGRFCEEDGYDFLLTPPVPTGPDTAGPAAGGGSADSSPDPLNCGPTAVSAEVADGPPVSGPDAGEWQIVVRADRAYFDVVRSLGGVDAAVLSFPRFAVERRFPLDRRQLLIGRRSRSRGVRPDIDLIGPPADPGVSHLHALLLPEPDGWALVDLESANGTYLNDPSIAPIAPNTPVRLGDGDRVYLGAWTVLTVRIDA